MPRRRTTTPAVRSAARRNIAKAQMSRRGTKEPRSVGRVTRSRARFSRPPISRRK